MPTRHESGSERISETWTWELSERAAAGLDALDADTQQRVLDKLDEVVNDEFRDPPNSPSH